MCLLLEIHAPAIKNKDMTTRKYLFANFTTSQVEYLTLNVEWKQKNLHQKSLWTKNCTSNHRGHSIRVIKLKSQIFISVSKSNYDLKISNDDNHYWIEKTGIK